MQPLFGTQIYRRTIKLKINVFFFFKTFRKNILQQQLTHYKEIIGKRVQENSPVITYQDNMQLARTSLHHLRLSKLQKDTVKQGKMWDFTVRGWREADIAGMENLFEDPKTATTQQQDVKTMTYAETKIGTGNTYNDMMYYI